MKRTAFSIFLSGLLLTCTACGQGASESDNAVAGESKNTSTLALESNEVTETEAATAAKSESESDSSKALVAYFSWSGNTEEMASYIAEQTGGDLLEIEPAVPYSEVYEEVGEVAKTERDENARPEIANLPESLDEYDTILIGYPFGGIQRP